MYLCYISGESKQNSYICRNFYRFLYIAVLRTKVELTCTLARSRTLARVQVYLLRFKATTVRISRSLSPVLASFKECWFRASACGSRTKSSVPPGSPDGATRIWRPGYRKLMSHRKLLRENTCPIDWRIALKSFKYYFLLRVYVFTNVHCTSKLMNH